MNLSTQLNNRAELWGKVRGRNSFGELTQGKPQIIKPIYCNVIPSTASKTTTQADTRILNHTHKFKVRAKSIDGINADMFFILNKEKYEFVSWNIDFKEKEYLDIFTNLKTE